MLILGRVEAIMGQDESILKRFEAKLNQVEEIIGRYMSLVCRIELILDQYFGDSWGEYLSSWCQCWVKVKTRMS